MWSNLPSSSAIARVSIKTTLIRVSDILSSHATEMFFIPLRSWRRAQRPPASTFRIGAVVVEGSAIEFGDRQGIYKDYTHKGQRFPELRCYRDVLYTAVRLGSSPITSRNQIQDRSRGCGGISYRVLGSPASYPIQPCNIMNKNPGGIDIIQLRSWL